MIFTRLGWNLHVVKKISTPMSRNRLLSRLFLLSFAFISAALLTSFSTDDDLSKDILKQTNKFRKTNGLDELEMRDDLNKIARKHSEDMAAGRHPFGHAGFSQRGVAIRKFIKYTSIAENVAYGSTDVKEVVTMWKGSPGHRKNLLGNYKYTGIGAARNRQGVVYYTQLFVR